MPARDSLKKILLAWAAHDKVMASSLQAQGQGPRTSCRAPAAASMRHPAWRQGYVQSMNFIAAFLLVAGARLPLEPPPRHPHASPSHAAPPP